MIIMLYEDVNENKKVENREKSILTESHLVESKRNRSGPRSSWFTRLVKLVMKRNSHNDVSAKAAFKDGNHTLAVDNNG